MNRKIMQSAVILPGAIGALLSACTMTPGASGDAGTVLTAAERAEGWQSLFGGSSLDAWRGYRKPALPDGWQVVDGSLTLVTAGAGDIITREQFRNFDLRLEWKVAPGGNSGIFYRATEEGNYIWQSASEMQVLDDERHADGKSELTSAGSNFALYPARRGVARPTGEWNAVRLLVNGSHIEHWLNGVKVVEYELGSPEWEARVRASKFASMPLYGRAPQGHIGLQDHGDRVEFRNIRIRVLP
ncbi:MAG: DUF1080 domain-containing protein [Gemmatimonadaceae bacterium]|nr:DUF1080 domain-containing protein [Gemmatimonadaceae bacterium]